MKALIALEDGTIFEGRSFTGSGEAVGEIVFNTSMSGYQEILTDPSYTGQIVTMTYPLIGNYGVNPEDMESASVHPKAFLVKEYGHGKEVIYNSEASRKHLDKAQSGGLFAAAKGVAMAKLSLNISIDSLTRGHEVECKSLDEVLAAEDAVKEACQNMKTYLEVAQSFNGQKETFEF